MAKVKAEKVVTAESASSRNPTDWATAKGFTQIVIWGPKQLNEDLKAVGAAYGMSKAEYARTVLAAAVEGSRKALKAAKIDAKSATVAPATSPSKSASKPAAKPSSVKKTSSAPPAAAPKPKTQKSRSPQRGADMPPDAVQDTHSAEIVQSANDLSDQATDLAA